MVSHFGCRWRSRAPLRGMVSALLLIGTLVGSLPALAGCPLSVSGMWTRLQFPATGEWVHCVYPDRDYSLDVFGPSSNNAYCIEPVNGHAEPRPPVGFDPYASCMDATYGDRTGWPIATLPSVPSSGIQGGLSPYGCSGQNYTLEHVFSYAKCPSTSCYPPPDGLKAWFPLDETSGTTVRDIRREISGTRVGPAIVNGRVGKALDFDGTGEYVELWETTPAFRLAIFNNDFTIDAWIKTSKSSGIIVAKRDGYFSGYLFMVFGGRLLLQMGDYDEFAGQHYYQNYLSPSSVQVADGNWHFVAVSVDRDSPTGGKMYVDGNLVHTFNPMAFQYKSLRTDPSVPFMIGKTSQGALDSYAYFDGIIDEVELFGRVVPESELDGIWAAGIHGKCKKTPSVCGNNLCESSKGESCSNCSADCGNCPVCGNGLCEPFGPGVAEDCFTCAIDCGPCLEPCDNDGICELQEGPSCADCCLQQPFGRCFDFD
ncbi:MAG: LamG domain-containing protein [Holophagales bacterium]|nr:LamG domain-containing protein [Holophagales bacterium]